MLYSARELLEQMAHARGRPNSRTAVHHPDQLWMESMQSSKKPS